MITTLPLTAAEKGQTWPKGRTCHKPGCTTPLSIHNGTARCGAHGGWQPTIIRNLDLAHERATFIEGLRDIMEQES